MNYKLDIPCIIILRVLKVEYRSSFILNGVMNECTLIITLMVTKPNLVYRQSNPRSGKANHSYAYYECKKSLY